MAAISNPYQTAPVYLANGWSPIPLRIRTKYPVPLEFTGAHGKYVDELQMTRWMKGEKIIISEKSSYTAGNIAIRLPKNVLGIDVDAYGDKAGLATLEAWESECGELPPTFVTSSKPAPSGIRLYLVPPDLAWPGQVGPGIEIIRFDHRYAMVYPSIHDKTGQIYKWRNKKGKTVTDYLPAPSELPKLPKKWVEKLTGGAKWVDRPVADLTDADMLRWLSDRVAPDAPCSATRAFVKSQQLSIRKAGDDGGGHDEGRDAVWGALGDASEGHAGISWALAKLRTTFIEAVRARRKGGEPPETEWKRFVERGIKKVAAEGIPPTVDPCEEIASGVVATAAGEEWDFTEMGNVERLYQATKGSLLYQRDMESWMVWRESTGLWSEDKIQPEQWVVKSLLDMKAEAAKTEDPKIIKAAASHFRTSVKPASIRSTLDLYRGRPGASIVASAFDARVDALACANGLVVLGNHGVEFRHLLMRDDHVTISTGVNYVAGARSSVWDAYLARVQPDEDVREWLRRLAAYSLLGANPARRFIVCMGPTSSGKGTYIKAMKSALGSYADDANLTVFRDNQDERARADLADALPKRAIFFDEASFSWKLHPDQIKRLTGAGSISARRPFAKAAIHRVPAFTPWMMTNSVPNIEGADAALRRRLIVVPFAETIAPHEEDIYLDQKLATVEGREAVLAWCVEGWADVVRLGYVEALDTPPAAFEALQKFTTSMSNIDAFIEEACLIGEEYHSRPKPLAEAWQAWQEENNLATRDRLNSRQFALQLDANGYPMKAMRVDGHLDKWRVGIQLNQQYASVYGAGS